MFQDSFLQKIYDKTQSGQRITVTEALDLYACQNLTALGQIARSIKMRKTGNRATYVVNRQINPTNICVLSCKFCDYATKKGQPNAYIMSHEEILSKLSPDLKEVHIVGGLYHEWSFEDYLDIVRLIHKKFPSIQIKAYTAVEIDFFARREKISIRQVLERLQEAGLVCLPGGGAEVFSERVRKALFPFKMGAPKWLEVHETAHALGIRSNATMLYGHIETLEERVIHMQKLRDAQDRTGGFLSFIPLAYQTGSTRVVYKPASAIDDLKTIAIARIFLDNFDHIKSYWVTMGEETAAMALGFGADDLDGTIGEEKIMHAAQASSPVAMANGRLAHLIESAGWQAFERDALYNFEKGNVYA